jgi:hypothetical protein
MMLTCWLLAAFEVQIYLFSGAACGHLSKAGSKAKLLPLA